MGSYSSCFFIVFLIIALASIVFPPLAHAAVGLMIALFTVVPLVLGYIILLDIIKRVKSATQRDLHPGDDTTE